MFSLRTFLILACFICANYCENEKEEKSQKYYAAGNPLGGPHPNYPPLIGVGGGHPPGIVGPHGPPPVVGGPSRRRLLRHLMRGRPGLLRRLLRRRNFGRRRRIVPVLPTVPGEEGVLPIAEESFEGSYVAVSGRPGQRTVHIVNGRGGVNFAGTVTGHGVHGVHGVHGRPGAFGVPGLSGHGPNPIVGGGGSGTGSLDYDYVFDLNGDGDADFFDGPLGARPAVPGYEPAPSDPGHSFVGRGRNRIGFSPLPRCTYINTDIYGDDVGDGKGLSAGSATGCKEKCMRQDSCQFWTYRDGWARDCYLKRGRRGDPSTTNAVPKVGYVSGTKADTCVCLPNSSNGDEEVCPVSYSRPIYPWKPRKEKPKQDRDDGRCVDDNGVVIPCRDRACFDADGVRQPGCVGRGFAGRGRDRGGGGDDGGVYRYDYDDYDVSYRDGIDDGIVDREVVTTRPARGRRQRPRARNPDAGAVDSATGRLKDKKDL